MPENEELLHGHGSRLPNLMREGHRAVVEYVHRRLADAGFADVRPAHMTIFQHLDAGGSRIGELAERSQLTNQSVSYLVDYLEEHGYVERKADPTNRRATLVCLTDRGWSEMNACAAILEEIDRQILPLMDPDEIKRLEEMLTKYGEAVSSLDAGNNEVRHLQ